MSYKIECPACHSRTSDVAHAFQNDEPCPNCGLPASTAAEVLAVQEREANAEVTALCEAATIRAGQAEAEVARLTQMVEQIRALLDGKDPSGW